MVVVPGDGGGDTNSPPTASFRFRCTDLKCAFDGTGSSDSDGTIASYAWDFGDGNTNTGATGTTTEEVTVAQSDQASMHVSDVSMSLEVRDTKAEANALVTWSTKATGRWPTPP